MRNDTKQAAKNIAQILEISEKYVHYDDREKVYVIENCVSENNFEVIKFNKDIQFDDLLDYPLKFHKCEFLESVIGYEKQFKHKLIFTNVTFKKVLNLAFSIFSNEINFFNVTLEYNIDCQQCEFKGIFKAFGVKFLKGAFFQNSTFEKEVHFGKEIDDRNTEKSNMFGSCSFETAIFENCIFFDKVYFKDNEFKQSFFKNSTFKDNVYFNNSHFYDSADFHECEFEKTACFYGVTFEKSPSFSQAIFKGSLNIVNTNLNFDFENLNERIKQEYHLYEKRRTRKEPGTIPNLYREKSLDKFANDFRDSFRNFKSALIKDNNLLDASNFHKYELYCKEIELDSKNPKIFSKDFIDKWQLFFYRITSNHHTDLLKIINNVVLLIAIFAVMLLCVRYQYNLDIFIKNHKIKYDCLMKISIWITDTKFMGLFYVLFVTTIFICRCISVTISLIITLIVIAINPKYILGIGGFIGGSVKATGAIENFLFVMYSIIMFLLLFSLQKTARKNSIIPN